MLVDFGKANLIDKARQQPDKVRQVFDKIKTDGLMPTIEAVRSKLDQPLAMGYCNVGSIIEVQSTGHPGQGFKVGDRVASNGKHAEVVCVPENLCAKVQDNVSDEAAAFTVIGAIALQGMRLVQPTLGEAVVVTGLGLVGLLTVQLLKANGCRVLGIDLDPVKVELARSFGAEAVDLSKGEDPLAAAQAFSKGRGVDAVIITASTKSSEPVHQAALMCRKRGRIVLVGVTGLELSRADFYEKELSFQVSCSYGPGRYDPHYEEGGQDYPIGFVRWTEQRNFEAVLDMMADGRLNLDPLISHRFALEEAEKAYEVVGTGKALGIILQYPIVQGERQTDQLLKKTIRLKSSNAPNAPNDLNVTLGVIGSGNYAGQVLVPAFKNAGAILKTVVSAGGVSAVHVGQKNGFEQASTDTAVVLADPHVNAVIIATRHDSHARFVLEALKAGKHVFVEKPLCLTMQQLKEIKKCYEGSDLSDSFDSLKATKQNQPTEPIEPSKCYQGSDSFDSLKPIKPIKQIEPTKPAAPLLMVGFNRRFAPHVVRIKELLAGVKESKSFIMTVNAGAIPPNHWTQDKAVGGGRIVGEGCHFIDLLRFLAGAPIIGHHVVAIGTTPGMIRDDKVSFSLAFAEGSFGTVHYLANGHKSFPKERLEVFCGGRILQLDNFRKLKGYGWPNFSKMNLWRQDKGQKGCAAAFVEAVRKGGPAPIPFEEVAEVTRVTLEIAERLG